MSKHTPGPWMYETRPDSGGGDRPVVVAGADLVAAVSRANGGANARLIAAAPDLLAALKDLAEWWSNWMPDDAHADGGRVVLDVARAAITKAEAKP